MLDAYTLRKTIPRLVVAAILISISWPLLSFAVQLSNDLGNGVVYLIESPFNQLPDIVHFGNVVFDLLSAGAILALGIIGLLSFVLTGAIAIFVAIITLIVRQILVIALLIISPIAIVAYVLPNTEKIFKLWRSSFISVLIAFPIISMFIATGRVFSAIAANNDGQNPVNQIIAFIAYFAPYFMLPLAFKLSGGIMGSVAGVINNRAGGVQKMLSAYRGNRTKENLMKIKSGERFSNRNGVSRTFNRLSENIGLGSKGHFGVGRQGQQSRALNRTINARNRLKSNEQLQQLAFDDNANGLLALSGGSEEGARNVANTLGLTTDETNRSIAAIKASGGFTYASATAALQTMAQNKSRILKGAFSGPQGTNLLRTSMNSLANGNTTLSDNLMNTFQFDSRNAGRVDLGGDPLDVGWTKTSTGHHAQSDVNSMEAFANHFTTMFQTSAPGTIEKKRATLALMEMQSMLPNSTEGNQVIINKALEKVGVDHHKPETTETQLTQLANDPDINENWIRGNARVYDSTVPYGSQNPSGQQSQQSQNPSGQQGPGGTILPSDLRLKKDIHYLKTTTSGLKLYTFKYIWSNTVYVGVIAQDIIKTHPNAITIDINGYYLVNYKLLGINMCTYNDWLKINKKPIYRV